MSVFRVDISLDGTNWETVLEDELEPAVTCSPLEGFFLKRPYRMRYARFWVVTRCTMECDCVVLGYFSPVETRKFLFYNPTNLSVIKSHNSYYSQNMYRR